MVLKLSLAAHLAIAHNEILTCHLSILPKQPHYETQPWSSSSYFFSFLWKRCRIIVFSQYIIFG